MGLVVPAVIPSSHADLEEKLASFARVPSVSRVQIDVVDGKFASPASWPYSAKATQGTPYCAKATQGTPYCAKATQGTPYSAKATQGTPYCAPTELEAMAARGEMLPSLDRFEYEIDLMCFDAEQAASAWLALGAARLTFHAESVHDVPRLLASARRRYGAGTGFTPGLVSFGLALNIASDLVLIEECLGYVAYVQFMGIAQIGRQGQPFDRRVVEKVRTFRARHPDMPVQVDGGISLANATELAALGVSSLIVGSGILRAGDPAATFAAFQAIESPFGV